MIELGNMLGAAMARRVIGTAGRAHLVGAFGDVQIAEAGVGGRAAAGASLGDLDIANSSGLTVLAVYENGEILLPKPDYVLSRQSTLVLAGSEAQLAAYDRTFSAGPPAERPVVILGGGRVGRAAAAVFNDEQVPFTIVEKEPGRGTRATKRGGRLVHGDAAELEILREAGIDDATAVLVTTHEDDMNVYLTLYARRLRNNVQVIARAVHERNVTTLHRAGADSVLSYAAVGATEMWNVLGISHRVVLAEGIELFTIPIPDRLVGHPLHTPEVYDETGCLPVATLDAATTMVIPTTTIPTARNARLLLMGNRHGERRFRERYRVPPRT